MAKKGKGKGDKPVSARGHVESNVVRFKLEQELIRIDRNGRPLASSSPLDGMPKKKLAQAVMHSDSTAPPVFHSKPPAPDNVASFTDHKAKREKDKPHIKGKSSVTHGWLNNTALAMNEFKHWSRITKEIGRSSIACEPWTTEGDKLSSPSLDLQRERSVAGHLKVKTKLPKVVSSVRNPFISEQPIKFKPLDPKFYMPPKVTGSAGLAPSGLPIRLFTEGKYKPKEKAVVYTTPKALPPTATRDWRAINDNRYDNAVTDWVSKTNGMVQWFINHVEPQNWPTHVHNFVHWVDGGPLVNTGAINQATAHPITELNLVKSLHEGLEKDWRMLDEALEYQEQEARLLRQELQATRNEVTLLEFELAHRTGDQQSVDEIRRELNVSSAKTPEDADVMLFQYRLYNSFVRTEGAARAFARFVWNDPELGKVMEDHADMRFNERQAELGYRNLVRFLRDFASYQLVHQREESIKFWKTDAILKYRKRMSRRNDTAVVDVGREAVSYAAMSRRAKPALHSSIYYSSFQRRKDVEQALIKGNVVRTLRNLKPKHPRYNNPALVEHDTRKSWCNNQFKGCNTYEAWWCKHLAEAELKHAVVTQPIKVAVVKTVNKIVDVLNTEINPLERKRKREWMAEFMAEHTAKKEKNRARRAEVKQERASKREAALSAELEAKAKAKQEKKERDHIRKMQRIAY